MHKFSLALQYIRMYLKYPLYELQILNDKRDHNLNLREPFLSPLCGQIWWQLTDHEIGFSESSRILNTIKVEPTHDIARFKCRPDPKSSPLCGQSLDHFVAKILSTI